MQALLVGLMVLVAAEPQEVPPPTSVGTPLPVPEAVPTAPASQLQGPTPELPLPYVPAPGWFGALEAGGVSPTLEGRRVAPGSFLTTPTPFPAINAGGLQSTLAVRGALGYRLDGGWGEFTLAFFGTADKHQTVFVHSDPVLASLLQKLDDANVTVQTAGPGPTGSTSLTTRLELETFDFGYGRHETVLGPLWDLRWQAGGRLATFFTDDQRQGPDTFFQAANHFVGSGPLVGANLTRFLISPEGNYTGSLYTHVGGGVLFGESQLTFHEAIAGQENRVGRDRQWRSVPMVEAELGICFGPVNHPEQRMLFCYRYERWWGIGAVGSSRMDLTLQGLFVRWEIKF